MRCILALALAAFAWACTQATSPQTPAQQLQACQQQLQGRAFETAVQSCGALVWSTDPQIQTAARAGAQAAWIGYTEAQQQATANLATVPASFVDSGACPGEGCQYGMWTARIATPLYERPDASSRQLSSIPVGEQVYASTGEVHVTPVRGRVVRNVGPFHVGDGLYRMGYIGEGVWSYWHNGRILRGDLGLGGDNEIDPMCEMSDAACQPVFAFPAAEAEGDPNPWWGRVRRSNGEIGWVSDIYEHFSGVDQFE